jgi:hypothetical protein
MNIRRFPRAGRAARCLSLAVLLAGLVGTPAAAGDPCHGCGFARPVASFPTNGCFGYYPTLWRPWPAECLPHAAAAVVAAPVPASGTPYAPMPNPTEKAGPPTVPATPPQALPPADPPRGPVQPLIDLNPAAWRRGGR